MSFTVKYYPLSQLLSVMIALVGAIVITGWYFHIPVILRVHPSFVPMPFNTALGMLLSGLAIFALLRSKKILTYSMTIGVLILGGLSLWQILTGVNLGIDQLLLPVSLEDMSSKRGRMAANTALCFCILAIAILVLSSSIQEQLKTLINSILSSAIVTLAFVSIIGYLLEFVFSIKGGVLTTMAIHTAGCFAILGLILFLQRLPTSNQRILPITSIALVVLAILVWLAMREAHVVLVQESAKDRASHIQRDWNEHITTIHKALQRMSVRINYTIGMEYPWKKDAEMLIADFDFIAMVRRHSDGTLSVAGDSVLATLLLTTLPANPCQTAKQQPLQFIRHPQNDATILMAHFISLASAHHTACIFTINSLPVYIEKMRLDLPGNVYPMSLSWNGATVLQEHSDGNWFTQIQLSPENSPVILALTPTKKQLEAGHLPEIILAIGLLLDGLILFLFYWWRVAHNKAHETDFVHAQLQESLVLHRGVLANAPYGIVLIDHAGIIELINLALEQLFGYSEHELVGKPIEILLPLNLQAGHITQRKGYQQDAGVAKKMATNRQVFGRHSSGASIAVEVNIAPVNSGDHHNAMAMVVDVGERLQAQQRQAELINKLTNVNEELNKFTYVASHDLKSPMRGIDQLAMWIMEDLGDNLPAETREHLRLMRSRILRMEKLLDDLLAYSRVGRSNDDTVKIDIRELVENIFELQPPQKNIQLMLSDLPVVYAQKVPLELVFRNLMSNAIKHHDKTQGTIWVCANATTEGFEFSVQDDGPGIPAEHQQRVFEMFQTLKPRDLVEGSGIGLALVKKAVDLMGGTITLESNGYKGCTFRFTWPTLQFPPTERNA